MAFKSSVQPLCRYCGKPIGKHTHSVWFGQSRPSLSDFSTNRAQEPKSKEEAQRLLNETIVSVSWAHSWVSGEKVRTHVHHVTTWDGESYKDEFFCNDKHARFFGYAAARAGQVMPAYREAKEALAR